MAQLFHRLGLIAWKTPQDILDSTASGGCPSVQGRLIRMPLNPQQVKGQDSSAELALEHAGHLQSRFSHLTDSLVCLHALTRGRSSSRRLRRTMSRVNALILASGIHPFWGYVHTEQNPADKPSRWGTRVRSKFRHAKA